MVINRQIIILVTKDRIAKGTNKILLLTFKSINYKLLSQSLESILKTSATTWIIAKKNQNADFNIQVGMSVLSFWLKHVEKELFVNSDI